VKNELKKYKKEIDIGFNKILIKRRKKL